MVDFSESRPMTLNRLFSTLAKIFDRRRSIATKLKKNFGQDDELFFRALMLFGMTVVTTSILTICVAILWTAGGIYMEPAARDLFGALLAATAAFHAAALALLMEGRLRIALAIVAWSSLLLVYASIALTGGVPGSVAAPTLILPPTIFLCLYGVSASVIVAVALPAVCAAQAYLLHLLGVDPPNFESQASPAFNRALVLGVTYVFVILALVVYGHMNALLRAQRDAERRRLQELANEDTLTGIANARHFRQRLEQACARIDRHGGKLAVLYLDFNDFKQVNDDYGHAMGDEVLRHVAMRLRLALRREDTVARLGGDEFAILVEMVSDEQQVPRLAERVRQIVAEPVDIDGIRHMITASVGRALYPTDVADKRAIVEHADRDMYRAKLEKRARQNSAA